MRRRLSRVTRAIISALAGFRDATACVGTSDFLCMCMGELILELWDEERELLGVVRFASHGELEWVNPDLGTLVLRDKGQVMTWLDAWAPAAAAA